MSHRHHEIGIGFNPQYLAGRLTCPPRAEYLEAGANLLLGRDLPIPAVFSGLSRFSLHLARAPFCEPPPVQEAFARRLAEHLPSHVSTIGAHLCGPFQKDLGYFGLGTSFEATPSTAESARRLLDILREATGRRILLENANYYDSNVKSAVQVLDLQNRLCHWSDAGIILDLAHLMMNAHNLGISSEYLLGRIDLARVSVIHLSGIVVGTDGAMHDGHQHPVHPEVWRLLGLVLALLDTTVTIVLEHSDPRWTDDDASYRADCEQLYRAIAAAPPPVAHPVDEERVAIGYMANVVLPQRFSALYSALGADVFGRIAREWGAAHLRDAKQAGTSFVHREEERALYDGISRDPVDCFADHLRTMVRS